MKTQIPVTVLGGYLGSGNTTMVNHLLRHANGVRLAVLVNEFGELPIDEDLIEAQDDDIISIAGGCVCCSFGSDLTGALMEMAQLDPPPDHLLIESSGVAIPSAIVGSVSLLDGFRTDGIVIVADAETVEENARSKYMSDTVLRQLSDANIIVLNKTDLVTTTAMEATLAWLKAQNPDVSVMKAQQGAVPMAAVLDRFAAPHATTAPHHHTASMQMTVLKPENPVDVEKLARELASDARGLVRAKGFATDLAGQKMLIQVVGNRWDISNAADDMADGIVCLGYKAETSEDAA
jgi:G3E family GTPase